MNYQFLVTDLSQVGLSYAAISSPSKEFRLEFITQLEPAWLKELRETLLLETTKDAEQERGHLYTIIKVMIWRCHRRMNNNSLVNIPKNR